MRWVFSIISNQLYLIDGSGFAGFILTTPYIYCARLDLHHACTIYRISMLISGSCLPEPVKCHGKPLIALPDRPYGPIYRLLVGVQMFVILRVVPSILPEIRYGGWYRNHICTVRFPTIFWYIEGTTPKIDLFQFLCMTSRTMPAIKCNKLWPLFLITHITLHRIAAWLMIFNFMFQDVGLYFIIDSKIIPLTSQTTKNLLIQGSTKTVNGSVMVLLIWIIYRWH